MSSQGSYTGAAEWHGSIPVCIMLIGSSRGLVNAVRVAGGWLALAASPLSVLDGTSLCFPPHSHLSHRHCSTLSQPPTSKWHNETRGEARWCPQTLADAPDTRTPSRAHTHQTHPWWARHLSPLSRPRVGGPNVHSVSRDTRVLALSHWRPLFLHAPRLSYMLSYNRREFERSQLCLPGR